MKKYLKEIIILLLQVFMYYIFPIFAGPTDVFGMILMIIISTFILAIIFAMIIDKKIKYGYPLIVALLFIPTIPIYYNSSAFIYTLLYLVIAFIGLMIGEGINLFLQLGRRRK